DVYKRQSLTREAIGAYEVIVIPIQQKWNHEILTKEIVPDIYRSKQSFIDGLKKTSLKVYNDRKTIYESTLEFSVNNIRSIFPILNGRNELSMLSGLCVPFSSRDDKKIGVMWMLFSRPFARDLSEEDKAIYQVYANQIALAYSSAKQSEELKQKLSKNTFELTANIDLNYKDARNQAIICFVVSLCTSIAGIILLFYGFYHVIEKKDKTSDTLVKSGMAALVGAFLQGVTVLAFNQGKAANERMDRYHKELYNVRKLQILLSATEQLSPETSPQAKQQIIQSTTNSWIESINETKNLEKPKEQKNLGKPN
ncbi:TRADD-N-associated membrane domain-containing protein, partial [Chamaesiphon polymorphus]